MIKPHIQAIITESIATKQRLLNDVALLNTLDAFVEEAIGCYRRGGKILFCGNGGSAADAQHLSAELSGRFYRDREPLFAEALHVNSSFLTAVANDYSFEEVYARMTRAMGRPGDMLVAISTSGNSPNILRAVADAKAIGMRCVGMTGASGGKLRDACDLLLNVPSSDTPRIQESHILLGHIFCELLEAALFPA